MFGNRSSRRAIGRVWLPVVLVVVALVASLLLPILARTRELAYRQELNQVINPARNLAAMRKAALQSGIAAQAGYAVSGNPAMLERAQYWSAKGDSLTTAFEAILPLTDAPTREAYDTLLTRLRDMDALRPPATPDPDALYHLVPRLEAYQERILVAFDSVDASLAEAAEARQARLDQLGGQAWIANAALALLGIAAVLSVARLTYSERRARAIAENAVRLRDEMVSVVSHDLRNPLSTVTMATGLLLDSVPMNGERKSERRSLEIIRRASDTMTHIIQDLLDIARIESGGLTVEPATLAVGGLTRDAVSLLAPIVREKGQRFVCQVRDGLPNVRADRERMLQILSNLVGNATKFTPRDGTVTLSAEAEGSFVWFRVADTGTGIPKEHIPYLFDRFWQASKADRRGIGLGLPIVKGLVEAQGGTIQVKSVPGQGSTFSFSVPQANGSAIQPQ